MWLAHFWLLRSTLLPPNHQIDALSLCMIYQYGGCLIIYIYMIYKYWYIYIYMIYIYKWCYIFIPLLYKKNTTILRQVPKCCTSQRKESRTQQRWPRCGALRGPLRGTKILGEIRNHWFIGIYVMVIFMHNGNIKHSMYIYIYIYI